MKDVRELNIGKLDEVAAGNLTAEEEAGLRVMVMHCRKNNADFYELVKVLKNVLDEEGESELWSYEKLNFFVYEWLKSTGT